MQKSFISKTISQLENRVSYFTAIIKNEENFIGEKKY